eukprot:scaffold125141_cov22-Tisochrysis_lutea.AAC.1
MLAKQWSGAKSGKQHQRQHDFDQSRTAYDSALRPPPLLITRGITFLLSTSCKGQSATSRVPRHRLGKTCDADVGYANWN